VLLILGVSGFAFYSVLNNIITSQQSKHLLNSTNSFVYQLESAFQDIDREFFILHSGGRQPGLEKSRFSGTKLDFVFYLQKDSLIESESGYFSDIVALPGEKFLLRDFVGSNPFIILKKFVLEKGVTLCYGRIIDTDFLNALFSRINIDIAVVKDNKTIITSNESTNQNLSFFLTEASKDLSQRNSFDIYSRMNESADLYATIYRPKSNFIPGNINFLIFSRLSESADLRNNLKYYMAVLGFAGISLSLILTLIFTEKLRKQIKTLNEATEITKTGNFHNRIKIQSNDEIGVLAGAFNTMLNELEKKEKINNEYSEFIALINQNPTLNQVAENALNKIIKTGGFNVGAIYSIQNGDIILTSSYGIKGELFFSEKKLDLFDPVLKKQEILELEFENDPPLINAGLIKVEIKNLVIFPIVYNFRVIAILELGSIKKPGDEAMRYIAKIKEQLAIGLTNATTLVQLENLVTELKTLNDDYQKQNLQVKEQNDALIKLHLNLKEKAEELEIQKLKAEESTKIKSQFLASMSHELRTPLNSIIGLTELIIEDKKITGKNRERISVILRNSQRLLKLINDILDLSKVESGKMEIINETFQLEDVLSEIHDSVNVMAVNKNLSFVLVKNCDTSVFLRADRAKIMQVLTNLLSNAIKFTDKGEIKLEVSSPENSALVFSIIDSGIGISEEDQKIIFEEFRQVDGTLTRKYSGTGLGLAICKKIALLLKGELKVESKTGKGSVFTFSIPLVKAPDLDEEAPLLPEESQPDENLVISFEEDIDIKSIFEQYFSSKGYEVEFESSARAGVEKVKRLHPPLVTINSLFRGNKFIDILAALKSTPATSKIPVSIVTIDIEKNIGYGFPVFEYVFDYPESGNLALAIEKIEKLENRRLQNCIFFSDSEKDKKELTKNIGRDDIKISWSGFGIFPADRLPALQPDFIVTKLTGQKGNAFGQIAELKSIPELKNVPVIALAGNQVTEEEKNQLTAACIEAAEKFKYHPLDSLRPIREQLRIIEELKILSKGNEIQPAEITDSEETAENGEDSLGLVLIVDDDPDTLFTISQIVEECSCRTVLANNGIECLNILQGTTPDLILLDIMMPGMDGFQTIKKIKENRKWKSIPIYAVTAKAMIDDKQVILKHGFDDYISKPVSANILAFKIQKVINKS
jgi:signal transduction histidine kinase/CheY-like chemotaxis protein